jgi:hypothetical protein
VIREERRAKTDTDRQNDDADQLSAAPALCEMQKLHHTRHVRMEQISRK